MEIIERKIGAYILSTDKGRIDIAKVHKFLAEESYWSKGIPMEIVKGSITNSLCFSISSDEEFLAFARVVSDYHTFAYLADVFVVTSHRKKGLSKLLLEFIVEHPQLQNLRRFCLGTHDAHSLYEKFGFKLIAKPEFFMEIKQENLYEKLNVN